MAASQREREREQRGSKRRANDVKRFEGSRERETGRSIEQFEARVSERDRKSG